jgi:DNA-binding IclR family transcriptional regulator
MVLEGVSDRANKVYETMKNAGMIGEEKMANADRITQSCKMPKNMVLAGLQELEQKGYAKRKAREKAAGYYILPGK